MKTEQQGVVRQYQLHSLVLCEQKVIAWVGNKRNAREDYRSEKVWAFY